MKLNLFWIFTIFLLVALGFSYNAHLNRKSKKYKGNIFEDNVNLAKSANDYASKLIKLSKKLTDGSSIAEIADAGTKLNTEFNRVVATVSDQKLKGDYTADFTEFMAEKEGEISNLFDAADKAKTNTLSDDDETGIFITMYEDTVAELNAKVLQFKSTVQKAEAKLNAAVRAIGSSLPPNFCWMKKIYMPKRCPASNPIRKAALCFQDCTATANIPDKYKQRGKERKFKLWGGICWEDCKGEGMVNKGIYCKGTNKWNFKRSFVPDSKTNFNAAVLCETGDTHTGALCYNPNTCSTINYENCGIAGCAKSTADCRAEISNMVIKTLGSLTTLGLFIASAGTSATITPWIGRIKTALFFLASQLVTHFQGKKLPTGAEWKTKVLAVAKPKYLSYLQSYAGADKATIAADVDTYLNEVYTNWVAHTGQVTLWNTVINSIKDQSQNLERNLDRFLECEDDPTEEGCMTDVFLPIISAIDPTGIASLISAFAYSKCPKTIAELNLTF